MLARKRFVMYGARASRRTWKGAICKLG